MEPTLTDQISKLIEELPHAQAEQRKGIIGDLVVLLRVELRERASRLMAAERPGHMLQTTALFHETYIRLVTSKLSFDDRCQFLGMSSRIMREIIIDLARRTNALKRGKGIAVTALDHDNAEQALAIDPASLLDLNRAIDSLDPQDQKLIELRFFYGLSLEETAEAMNLNYETLRKRWISARRELYHALAESRT